MYKSLYITVFIPQFYMRNFEKIANRDAVSNRACLLIKNKV